jgi:hypothetical protein
VHLVFYIVIDNTEDFCEKIVKFISTSKLRWAVYWNNHDNSNNYKLHFTYLFLFCSNIAVILPVGMLIPSPMKRMMFLAMPSFLSELTAFA